MKELRSHKLHKALLKELTSNKFGVYNSIWIDPQQGSPSIVLSCQQYK